MSEGLTIIVNVVDVVGGRYGCAITIRSVVVSTVELVHDESRPITADILDLLQLRVLHHLSGGIAGIGRQDDRSSSRDLLDNLLRMDMILVLGVQRRRNRHELEKVSTANPTLRSRGQLRTFLKRLNISL